MPTAEELLIKLQEIDDLHRDDKKSFIDALNSERDKKIFYEKSQQVNQFILPKDMEDREELLELCQINYQQLENAEPDHLMVFRPQLKDAWQNLAKRIVKKIKRYGQLNDDTINYARGCGFDPNSDNLEPVDIKQVQGAGVPKSLGDIKAGLNLMKDAYKDAKEKIDEQNKEQSIAANLETISSNINKTPENSIPQPPSPEEVVSKAATKTKSLFQKLEDTPVKFRFFDIFAKIFANMKRTVKIPTCLILVVIFSSIFIAIGDQITDSMKLTNHSKLNEKKSWYKRNVNMSMAQIANLDYEMQRIYGFRLPKTHYDAKKAVRWISWILMLIFFRLQSKKARKYREYIRTKTT